MKLIITSIQLDRDYDYRPFNGVSAGVRHPIGFRVALDLQSTGDLSNYINQSQNGFNEDALCADLLSGRFEIVRNGGAPSLEEGKFYCVSDDYCSVLGMYVNGHIISPGNLHSVHITPIAPFKHNTNITECSRPFNWDEELSKTFIGIAKRMPSGAPEENNTTITP